VVYVAEVISQSILSLSMVNPVFSGQGVNKGALSLAFG
jgi:hypothetical protein